jgi:hypothetical protein
VRLFAGAASVTELECPSDSAIGRADGHLSLTAAPGGSLRVYTDSNREGQRKRAPAVAPLVILFDRRRRWSFTLSLSLPSLSDARQA